MAPCIRAIGKGKLDVTGGMMPGTPYPKEQMHRIAYTKLTPEQITDKLGPAAKSGPTSASPLSDVFAGKSIKIVTDNGPALAYTFSGTNRLSVTENSGAAVDAGYGALTLGRTSRSSRT